ncbi:amino acid permease [Lactococcus allomyrinae]|uniref:Amino acid permease n=1 Tax=Lactococcus allomyrinae TaxID=2419773 RepID=A0A387BTF7_9LACT|nr:amino acid permease [Lactococcus allomyrinae]AYG01761.1 amino acid permease [Lactococcus allomyrinae]
MEQTTEGNRGLQNRHIQLIAIAGTIGTGLFLGAGKTIRMTGPSIIFAYIIIGIAMFFFLRTIGEMLYQDPSQHSFLNFVTKYAGTRIGYFTQWSYWLVLVFVCISELTAIGTYVQFWLPQIPLWLIEVVMLALLFSLNTLNARFFGETEFWFAIIKVAAILGMIVTAIILMISQFSYTTTIHHATIHGTVSFANILNGFQLFPRGVWNFIGALQMVMFAFTSMEFIGMTAAETVNPRKTLPRAINQIPIRILIFYVGALLAIMAIFDWNNVPADKSPFVMVFQLIGIKWAAALVNFVVLTSAGSALNSSLFSATRNMYALAKQHDRGGLTAFTKLSRHGIPLNALYLAGALALFAPILTLIPQIKNAFDFAASCTTNLFLIVYFITVFSFWKYRKSSDFDPNGFLTPKAKITVPLVVLVFAIVFISLFFNSETLYPAIGAVVWTVLFGLFSYFKKINPENLS